MEWTDIERIFFGALDRPAQEREAWVKEAVAGDAGLEEEVRSLLRAHDESAAAEAPQPVGPYRLERILGRGGMGEVWLARRADQQYEKKVAIKLVRPGIGAGDLIERFLAERQILADLQHPNIATLLEGGVTQTGQPYLVMEYVEGTRLDEYCDGRRLSIPERLELFTKVCAAVNSAHQHMVIHRDLKPGNILVTAEGEPKLLDFGIAKVLKAPSGSTPGGSMEQTVGGGLYLTPLYASPELLLGRTVTAASDVYSLGVILYELLCGMRPYDSSGEDPADLIYAAISREPERPSAAVERQPGITGASMAETVALRGTTADKLKRALQGDLDGIALRALAKTPEERYGSAEQLSSDIRRYLTGQPVSAVEGTRLYIARKFVRRHAAGAALAGLLLISLLGGLAGTLWQAHVAQGERANAESRFNDARQLANYVLFDLQDSIQKVPGAMPVQAELAGRTLQYLDRLAVAKGADRSLQMELGEGYLKLGDVLGQHGADDSLGDTTKALASYRKALALVEPLSREDAGNVRVQQTLARIYQQMGGTLVFTAQPDDGIAMLRRAADTFEQLAAVNPSDLPRLIDAGAADQALGQHLSQKGGGFITLAGAGAAIGFLQKAAGYFDAALKIDPSNSRTLQLLSATDEAIGKLESPQDPRKAVETYGKALALLRRLPPTEQETPDVRRRCAMMLVRVGWNQGQLQEFKESLASLNEARDVLDGQAAADPQNATAAFRQVDVYRSLGIVQGYAGNAAASEENLRRAVEILDRLVERDPLNTSNRVLRASLQGRIGNLAAAAGRIEEARRYAEAGLAYLKEAAENPNATVQQLVEAVRVLLDPAVETLRDYPLALRYALRADGLAKGKDLATLVYLGEAYWRNGNASAAVETARKALASSRQRGRVRAPPTRGVRWKRALPSTRRAQSARLDRALGARNLAANKFSHISSRGRESFSSGLSRFGLRGKLLSN
jgi:non-specific serine/threonine protein kinase/serine/threonine-protein kinase